MNPSLSIYWTFALPDDTFCASSTETRLPQLSVGGDDAALTPRLASSRRHQFHHSHDLPRRVGSTSSSPNATPSAPTSMPTQHFAETHSHSEEYRMRLARFSRSLLPVLIAGAMCLVGTAVWAQGTVTGRWAAEGGRGPARRSRRCES